MCAKSFYIYAIMKRIQEERKGKLVIYSLIHMRDAVYAAHFDHHHHRRRHHHRHHMHAKKERYTMNAILFRLIAQSNQAWC